MTMKTDPTRLSRHMIGWCLLSLSTAVPLLGADTTWTLADVHREVQAHHPSIQAAQLETRAQEARQRYAAPYPNPELETELENIYGSGPFEGLDAAEITFLLGQEIPLGGKQGIRRRQATLDAQLAARDQAVTERDVITIATKAFYSALAAQEHVALVQEMVQLSEAFRDDTRRRVDAGSAPELEWVKASIALEESRIEFDGAQQQFRAATEDLAYLLGKPSGSIPAVSGHLTDLPALPPPSDLARQLQEHPAWKVWDEAQAKARADQDEADADRIPDVAVGAGVRFDRDADAHSFLVQAAFPLPIWNRNQGPRAAARQTTGKVEAETEAARRALQITLNQAYAECKVAFILARGLEQNLLPAVEQAYQLSRDGYQSGRFGFLDVLEARSKLFEHRRRQIEVLTRCRHALADIAYLTGQPGLPLPATSSDPTE